ncbi:MAG: type II toxin-antitoxin system VapC family toxin [Candidatus Omnitrophica bacterium]|nr:type II toxin-antitoxin system VapC family toxin [Candidatus Omnitrophota bacterium]
MLVDTDVLIWYLRGEKKAAQFIDRIGSFEISAINYMEILHGLRNKTELRAWKEFIKARGIKVILIDHDITTKAIYWTEEYGLSHGLRLADALIASTADVYGKELLTGNVADYRFIPGLVLKPFRLI